MTAYLAGIPADHNPTGDEAIRAVTPHGQALIRAVAAGDRTGVAEALYAVDATYGGYGLCALTVWLGNEAANARLAAGIREAG
jgi:hypothetical protein